MWKINCLLIDLKMVHIVTFQNGSYRFRTLHIFPALVFKAVSRIESHSQLVRGALSITLH